MKVIRIPFSYKILSLIHIFIVPIGFTMVLQGISWLRDNEISIAIITILISSLLFSYQWLRFTGQLVIMPSDYIYRFIFRVHVIERGFQIIKGKKEQTLLWQDISFVDLKNHKELVFQLKNRKTITIDNLYWNWYLLLKNIPPEKTTNEQIEQFKNDIFSNLKTCGVCGQIAVHQQKCLSCRVDYSDIQEEDLEDFIKLEQLELFSIDEKDEKVDFYENNNDGFEFNKNWKPIVTKEELIKDYEFINEETITPWLNQLSKRFKT